MFLQGFNIHSLPDFTLACLCLGKKAVGFKGLDWEFKKSKLEQRFQRRREKKQSKLSKISLAANIKNFLRELEGRATAFKCNVESQRLESKDFASVASVRR